MFIIILFNFSSEARLKLLGVGFATPCYTTSDNFC